MPHQLPLAFKFNNEFTFDTFVPGTNAELVASLKTIGSTQDFPAVYFWGRSGSGKTHLIQALCQCDLFNTKPVAIIPLDLTDEAEVYAPQMLEGLEKMSLVCIDGIQVIAGNSEWETALFHLYNRAREMKTPLVICGDEPPAQLKIELKDLKTRLGWGLVLQLQPINDEDKLKALRLRAHNRGIELSDEVGEYLLRRHSRQMRDLISLLDILDHASLTEQRRLTIPFVKQFLEDDRVE